MCVLLCVGQGGLVVSLHASVELIPQNGVDHRHRSTRFHANTLTKQQIGLVVQTEAIHGVSPLDSLEALAVHTVCR